MRSSSVSKLVGASDFIHIDDLEVRGSVPSNRKPSLALLLSSVVSRDSPCASPRCLQAAQVVLMKRELLQRGCAAARWLPRLPWPTGPSCRTCSAGGAIDIALNEASAWHACSMQLRGSRGADLAGSGTWQPCLPARWSWAAWTS